MRDFCQFRIVWTTDNRSFMDILLLSNSRTLSSKKILLKWFGAVILLPSYLVYFFVLVCDVREKKKKAVSGEHHWNRQKNRSWAPRTSKLGRVVTSKTLSLKLATSNCLVTREKAPQEASRASNFIGVFFYITPSYWCFFYKHSSVGFAPPWPYQRV